MNASAEPPDAPPRPNVAPAAPPSPTSEGHTIDAGRGRVFPCERCGAELVFNIGDQRLKCPHCGFEKDVVVPPNATVAEQDFEAMVAQLKKQAATRMRSKNRKEPRTISVVRAAAPTLSLWAH